MHVWFILYIDERVGHKKEVNEVLVKKSREERELHCLFAGETCIKGFGVAIEHDVTFIFDETA